MRNENEKFFCVMRHKNLLLTLTFGLAAGFMFTMFTSDAGRLGYTPRSAAMENRSVDQAIEHFKSKRLNSNGIYDPAEMKIMRENVMMQIARQNDGGRAVSTFWYEEGPSNIGGRTRSILILKDNPLQIFAGSVTGGLWASANGGNNWAMVSSFNEVLTVSALAQTGNGRIYVGTGFGGYFNEGWSGNGIYFSDDFGATWTSLTGTTSYAGVGEIIADPVNPNLIWIATSSGLKTFDHTVNTSPVTVSAVGTGLCYDVKVAGDGQTIVAGVALSGIRTYVTNDAGTTWTNVSGSTAGLVPNSGVGRIEYAISDVKNSSGMWNIYASIVTSGGGILKAIMISENSGLAWTEIAPASSTGFDPFRTGLNTGQGVYDNVISVVPGEPEKILVGGIDIYAWEKAPGVTPTFGQWEQRSLWFASPTSPVYVHADNHEMEWDDATGFLYIGNDGGIGKSPNQGSFFFPANRGYNVTQFYSVAFSADGDVMGGTQDNGSLLNTHSGSATFLKDFSEIRGGDGFDCDISHIDEDVMFASVYNGDMQRSDDGGNTFSPLISAPSTAPFHTVGRLYENPNDVNSTETIGVNLGHDSTEIGDTLAYIAMGSNPAALRDTIIYQSKTLQIPLTHVVTSYLIAYEDGPDVDPVNGGMNPFYFQDPIQSLYAIGFSGTNGVYLTREALRFSVTPEWKKMTSISGALTAVEFSTDGLHLFAGTSSGSLLRISGLETFYAPDYDTTGLTVTQIFSGGSSIEAIAIDPNDPDHVVVTMSGTSTGRIYETLIATTTGTTTGTGSFTNIHGNLSGMPVFAAVIPKNDPNVVLIGTEFGLWATDNTNGGSTQWTYQSNGPGLVPVYELRQQTRDWSEGTSRPGEIYAGTFGRGIWRSENFLSARPVNDMPSSTTKVLTTTIFPNPMQTTGKVSFDLVENGNVQMRIINIQGQTVQNNSYGNLSAGKQTVNVDVTNLATGTYFVQVISGKYVFNGKLIVTR
jgi:hypothetical protein